jgi:hypothetical protein
LRTGELLPVVTLVTDNDGPFRSSGFEAFIEFHPERCRVRTRGRPPGKTGRTDAASTPRCTIQLFIDEIDDAVMLAKHVEEDRIEYNQTSPHEAIAWNRPL